MYIALKCFLNIQEHRLKRWCLNIFYQRYARKIKNAGLPHTRFHDLRHFAATNFLDAGVPDKYAAAYLGHTDINMTKKYQHIRQQVIPFPLGDTAPKVIIDTLPDSVRSV